MPVSGSLDDPEFGIGSVLWKAFVNLITKIVTSPFRLLGSLIGIESEDLGPDRFLARAQRPAAAGEGKARAHRARRWASGRISAWRFPAVVDPKADAAVLRTLKMEALVEAELAASGKPESGRGLEKRTRKVIETLYQRSFPDQSLDAVQQKFQAPPPDEPAGKPRLDELAYLDELRGQIAAAQVVGDEELTALATARAAAISAELTATGQIPAETGAHRRPQGSEGARRRVDRRPS